MVNITGIAMTENLIERIQAFNSNKIPAMRAIKFKKMRSDVFAFFRGSSHLFYEDWPKGGLLDKAPLTWICGDLHLENFGTYQSSNGLVYFDINDFDDAALAPFTWDVTRLATSLFLAGDLLNLSEDSSHQLCIEFLEKYFSTLAKGSIHSLERDNVKAPIKKLLRVLKSRRRSDLLDDQTRKLKTERRFKNKDSRYLPVSEQERETVTAIVSSLGESLDDREFYKIHDIAFRVAGNGSLGINRYAVIVEGRGFPDSNTILDIKEERPSVLQAYLSAPQPKWASQAERIVSIQKRFQAVPPALLTTAKSGNRSYVVRELQPAQDRINLASWDEKFSHLEYLVECLAEILAWGELRSAGRQGSALGDELITFGNETTMIAEIISYAQLYAHKVRGEYKLFANAYDGGKLE
jgi:uncharacterized protein (DUF2252 family)